MRCEVIIYNKLNESFGGGERGRRGCDDSVGEWEGKYRSLQEGNSLSEFVSEAVRRGGTAALGVVAAYEEKLSRNGSQLKTMKTDKTRSLNK